MRWNRATRSPRSRSRAIPRVGPTGGARGASKRRSRGPFRRAACNHRGEKDMNGYADDFDDGDTTLEDYYSNDGDSTEFLDPITRAVGGVARSVFGGGNNRR